MKKTLRKLSLKRETVLALEEGAFPYALGGMTLGSCYNSCSEPETGTLCREPSMYAISVCISACTSC
jgi:hypothetical protein